MANIYGVRNLKQNTKPTSNPYYVKDYDINYIFEKLTGRGLQLIPMYDLKGSTVTNIGVARVTQSLFVLLSTPKGSRFFNPDFGTDLYKYLFENNSNIVCDLIKDCVTREIKMWEKRIDFNVKVTNNIEDNKFEVSIKYNLKGQKDEYTYIFPVDGKIHELGGVIE